MRFVPVKSAEQQAILSLHRVRQGFIEQRTATINRIRGLLAEFGVVLPQRAEQVRRAAVVMAEELPVLAREAIADLRAHLTYLDERITRYERQLVSLARQREAAVRIQRLPGVGPLTASAITASISDGRIRQRSAVRSVVGIGAAPILDGWQSEIGADHQTWRSLLAHAPDAGCARNVAEHRTKDGSPVAVGAGVARASRYHRAIIAVAAKNARIIGALLAKHREFVLPT
jgi:transposase